MKNLLERREAVKNHPDKVKYKNALEQCLGEIREKYKPLPWVGDAIVGEIEEEVVDSSSSSEEEIEPQRSSKRRKAKPSATSKTTSKKTSKRKKVGSRKAPSVDSDSDEDFMETTAGDGHVGGVVDGVSIRKKIVGEREVGKGAQLLLKFIRPGYKRPTYQTIPAGRCRGAREAFIEEKKRQKSESHWHIEKDARKLKHQVWEHLRLGGVCQQPGPQRIDTNTLPTTFYKLRSVDKYRPFKSTWFYKSAVTGYFDPEMVEADEMKFAKLSGQKLAKKLLTKIELAETIRSGVLKKYGKTRYRDALSSSEDDSEDDEPTT